jgi:hypothetical protein
MDHVEINQSGFPNTLAPAPHSRRQIGSGFSQMAMKTPRRDLDVWSAIVSIIISRIRRAWFAMRTRGFHCAPVNYRSILGEP